MRDQVVAGTLVATVDMLKAAGTKPRKDSAAD